MRIAAPSPTAPLSISRAALAALAPNAEVLARLGPDEFERVAEELGRLGYPIEQVRAARGSGG